MKVAANLRSTRQRSLYQVVAFRQTHKRKSLRLRALTWEGRQRAALVDLDCRKVTEMTTIQPELWVDAPGEAVTFYQAAFGATVLHRVGDGNDIVAQLFIEGAAFWISAASPSAKRLSPRTIDGATSRTLLVVENPTSVIRQAVNAGATETASVQDEHGWRLGRIVDPFGHEWEIGRPLGRWPPA
jgi:PhnB protein